MSEAQAAAWATIPGSGPQGVDPWAILEEMGSKGESTGVRVARGLQVTIAVVASPKDTAKVPEVEQTLRMHTDVFRFTTLRKTPAMDRVNSTRPSNPWRAPEDDLDPVPDQR